MGLIFVILSLIMMEQTAISEGLKEEEWRVKSLKGGD